MEPPQDQPLKTSNNGQMGKVVEPCVKQEDSERTPPLAQSQEGSAAVPRDALPEREEEPHETHSFTWCWKGKSTEKTCNKATTVESLLKTSSQFRKIADSNKNKELVIVRDGKAISSHFPCSLIKNEPLTIKYIKAVDELAQSVSGSGHRQRKGPSSELVTFHLRTKGGKNVKRIMRNPALIEEIEEIEEITVYAYKGEKVKRALERDGRLQTIVFTKNCALSNKSTSVTTEMSDLVDKLDGKTFRIILLNRSSPPDSQPGSLDDAYTTQNESQRSDKENQDPPQQSSATESVNVDTQKKTAGLDGRKAPDFLLGEMPNSQKMRSDLSLQFQDFLKGTKIQQAPRLSRIQNLLRVEYGKNAETCLEVKTMKTLMELSNSVCHVRVKERPEGSGFLLFDKFVLTNGHVLQNIYDQSTGQLNEEVTVHFSYESLDQVGSGVKVEEVVGFEKCCDVFGHQRDWALLKIGAAQNLPVLLKHFGFLPQSGGICIIGHPDGAVKKIDPCFIVPTENRNQVVDRHRDENPDGVLPHDHEYIEYRDQIKLVTRLFFGDTKCEQNRQALTYETCFYFGSSGSPVFDEHCNVVAMHSGGYVYKNARGVQHSVIEFGHPLSVIIERIIVQMVEGRRFDVLKKYLACSYRHQHIVRANVKKLVESRNMQAFIDAAKQPEVTNDESLNTFFEFWSQGEVPMEH